MSTPPPADASRPRQAQQGRVHGREGLTGGPLVLGESPGTGQVLRRVGQECGAGIDLACLTSQESLHWV